MLMMMMMMSAIDNALAVPETQPVVCLDNFSRSIETHDKQLTNPKKKLHLNGQYANKEKLKLFRGLITSVECVWMH